MIADNYLNVLAKIMREQVKEPDMMNKLYHIIDEELYLCLKKIKFPSLPELSKRLNQMLYYINGLSLYPELAHKEIICLYGHYTNELIDYVKPEVSINDYSWIENYRTEIPIIIVDSPSIEIDVVSQSFTKVTITKNELELLISESKNTKISINKLIKFLVFKLPLKNIGKCFLLDNTYKQLTQIYDELIITKIYITAPQEVKYIKPGYISSVDYLYCIKNSEAESYVLKLISNSNVKWIKTINFADIFKNKTAIISFYDIYKYAVSPMINYYNKNIKNTTQNLGEITSDLVRNENEILDDLNDQLTMKLEKYQQDKKMVDDVLSGLEKEIKSLDEKYKIKDERNDSILNKCLKNYIFMYYFSIVEINSHSQEEKECIKRILDYGYEYTDLLLSYSKAINKKNADCPKYNKDIIKEWECAKMLLLFQKEEKVNDDIKSMINSLGKSRVTTAKEWYYWALIYNDKNALKKSVQLGCEMANKKLYDDNKGDIETKKFLSSVLYSDACIDIGTQEAYKGEEVTSIKDKRLAYLKIAAAIGDDRGIQLIADILFKNVIWEYFRYEGKPITASEDREVYTAVLGLYEILVSKRKNLAINRESIAIIKFCLNINMSEVHAILYNKSSYAAYFCKGYLSEYGLYNKKDLDNALRCYEQVDANVIPAVTNAKKRVKSNISTREKEKEEEYNKEENYQGSSSSSIVDSSWCFITTAASCALNKGRNCDELNFLRKFRDEHIKVSDEGNALVKEYYNIAPKLIEKIDKEENSSKIYADLWTDYIVPSVKEIKQGNWQRAQDIYVMMVVDLSKKYDVEINTEGYEKLYHDTLKRIRYEN